MWYNLRLERSNALGISYLPPLKNTIYRLFYRLIYRLLEVFYHTCFCLPIRDHVWLIKTSTMSRWLCFYLEQIISEFFCSNKTRDNVQILEGISASVGATCLCDPCQNDFTSSKPSRGVMLIRDMCFSQRSVPCWVSDNSTLDEGDVPLMVVVEEMRIRVLPPVVFESPWAGGEQERWTDTGLQAITWCGCVLEKCQACCECSEWRRLTKAIWRTTGLNQRQMQPVGKDCCVYSSGPCCKHWSDLDLCPSFWLFSRFIPPEAEPGNWRSGPGVLSPLTLELPSSLSKVFVT